MSVKPEWKLEGQIVAINYVLAHMIITRNMDESVKLSLYGGNGQMRRGPKFSKLISSESRMI